MFRRNNKLLQWKLCVKVFWRRIRSFLAKCGHPKRESRNDFKQQLRTSRGHRCYYFCSLKLFAANLTLTERFERERQQVRRASFTFCYYQYFKDARAHIITCHMRNLRMDGMDWTCKFKRRTISNLFIHFCCYTLRESEVYKYKMWLCTPWVA